jgi:hypothetical protein
VIAAVVLLDHVPLVRTSSATLLQCIAAGGTAMAWVTRRLEQFSSATRRAEQLRQRVTDAWASAASSKEEVQLARQIQDLEAAIQRADDEIGAAETRAAEAEAEIQRINAGGLVYDFLTERRQSTQYLTHLGLISTIRQDFEKLRDLLADLQTHGTRPIDRIILYVDDLDRCAPDKVVEVLQAIHLLLAFDIFNVVVGVDARWLERSLNESYAPQVVQGGQVSGALPFRAQNYLEKIFQISYSLDAMNDKTFGSLIGELVPTRSEVDAEHEKGSRPASSETERVSTNASSGTDPGHNPSAHSPAQHEGRERAGSAPSREELIDVREAVGTLFFEDFEEEYLKGLHPFIETPRLAKRLVNVYRLLRLRASEENFEAFVSSASAGTYQAALLLLAINTGFPQAGRRLLAQLASLPENAEGSLTEFVGKLQATQNGPTTATPDELSEFESVRNRILAGKDGMAPGLASYVHWASRVGRYSFDWQAAPAQATQPGA